MIHLIRLLLVLLLAPASVHAQAPVLLRGPYLQMASPTTLTIRWRTDLPGTGTVRCGTEENQLTMTFTEPAPVTEHVVRLTGLTPATHYYYAVKTDETEMAAGAACHFYTPPADGANVPVRFWVLGDCGTQNIHQEEVRNAFAPVHAQRRADLWLMLGDNAYPDCTDQRYQLAVFDMYSEYLRQMALWSCIGNHETLAGLDEQETYAHDRVFTFPTAGECGGVASGTERYYSWNYGPIHFISLDSMTVSRAADGAMAQWVRTDLEANTLPWVVALWHHPPYTKGSHNSDFEIELVEMRQNILPILEGHGVDLVLCGHSHCYERSYLIDGHYGTSDTFTNGNQKDAGNGRADSDGAYLKAGTGMTPNQGAVYVVAGSSGQVSGGTLDHPAHFISLNKLGSLVVDVSGTRMDVKFLREKVNPEDPPFFEDSFTIIKGVEPPPQPQLTRGPYLQKASSSAMTIRWRTSLPATGRIRYGTAVNALTSFVDEGAPAALEHSVRLTGLTPGTKYYYRVEATGRTIAGGSGYNFTTPPVSGSNAPQRIWILGDAGTRTPSQLAVREAFGKKHGVRPANQWIMLGGNAYAGGTDADYQAAVFDVYSPFLQQSPLWSCLGTTEVMTPPEAGLYAWDNIFDMPAGGESGGVPSGSTRYYSWNHGNVHFIALDSVLSSRAAGGPMAQWLTADLQANTLPWTIVCFHHSPYTKGTADSDARTESIEMRNVILPILDQYGVDMVFSAGSQVYERSFFIKGHYGASSQFNNSFKVNTSDGRTDGGGAYVKYGSGREPNSGIVYVTMGSSGQAGGGPLNHPAHILSLNRTGSVFLDVSGDRLDFNFLRESSGPQSVAVIDDYFTILKYGPPRPAVATGLAVLPLSASTALLHWKDNSVEEDRYRVRMSPVGGFWSWLTLDLPPNTVGYTVNGLNPGSSYDIMTVAQNLAGSTFSDPHRFTHPAVQPPVTSAEKWRFTYWGVTSAGGERAESADPDGDGYINLLEYALGSSPVHAISGPQLTASRTLDGRLAITFVRQAVPELTYAVEFSPSLAGNSWQTAWTSSGVENLAGVITIPEPGPAIERRFVRLRVTSAP